jgi:hypothetical protein
MVPTESQTVGWGWAFMLADMPHSSIDRTVRKRIRIVSAPETKYGRCMAYPARLHLEELESALSFT